jgi:hypothetical protein
MPDDRVRFGVTHVFAHHLPRGDSVGADAVL